MYHERSEKHPASPARFARPGPQVKTAVGEELHAASQPGLNAACSWPPSQTAHRRK